MSNAWEPCPKGCGLHHRVGNEKPAHSTEWMEARIAELARDNARLRGKLELLGADADCYRRAARVACDAEAGLQEAEENFAALADIASAALEPKPPKEEP